MNYLIHVPSSTNPDIANTRMDIIQVYLLSNGYRWLGSDPKSVKHGDVLHTAGVMALEIEPINKTIAVAAMIGNKDFSDVKYKGGVLSSLSEVKQIMNNPTNRVLCADVGERYGFLLGSHEPNVPLTEISVGKRFQFSGDHRRVREVVDVDGEFVMTKTLGDMSDLQYYKLHYSWLRPNETPLSYLQ